MTDLSAIEAKNNSVAEEYRGQIWTTIRDLCSEVRRLRGALEKIAGSFGIDHGVRDLARTALEESK